MLNHLFDQFLSIGTTSQVLLQSILSLFSLASLGCHPKVYVGLIIYSLHFSSIELNPRLNLSFIFDPMVCHQQDTILCSISVYSLFIWFLIMETLSWVLSILNHLFICFLIIGTSSQVLSQFIVHLVSYHPKFYYGDAVLGSIQVSPFFLQFLIVGTPSQVLSQFFCFFIWFLNIETLSQVLSNLNCLFLRFMNQFGTPSQV